MKPGRRRLVLGGAAIAAAPRLASAQSADRALRLAILSEANEATRRQGWKTLFGRLAELGYVEGRNLAVESRHANGDPSKLPGLAAGLVAWRPDVIVAVTTPAALAAKNATTTIPVVFVGPADPVGSGLVPNLGRPGGNATGFSPMQAEIGGKWIELLRELAPGLKRAAYLTDTGNGGEMLVFEQIRLRATSLRVDVQVFDGIAPGALDRSFDAIAGGRFDGLMVALTQALLPHRDRIVAFASRKPLPAIYARREYPDAGGLISYGADTIPLFARAAEYVQRIAQGAKPADLPVERPTYVRMVVNQRTARAQGFRIPQSVLVGADEVID